jgi:hypothetical protein
VIGREREGEREGERERLTAREQISHHTCIGVGTILHHQLLLNS